MRCCCLTTRFCGVALAAIGSPALTSRRAAVLAVNALFKEIFCTIVCFVRLLLSVNMITIASIILPRYRQTSRHRTNFHAGLTRPSRRSHSGFSTRRRPGLRRLVGTARAVVQVQDIAVVHGQSMAKPPIGRIRRWPVGRRDDERPVGTADSSLGVGLALAWRRLLIEHRHARRSVKEQCISARDALDRDHVVRRALLANDFRELRYG